MRTTNTSPARTSCPHWLATPRPQLAVLLIVAACGHSRDVAARPAKNSVVLDSLVTWMDRIDVQETPDVINVFPIVRYDPAGGFLVVDPHECQFRRYDKNGNLVAHFGRKGQGSDGFERPTVAVRLPTHQILVVDRRTKLVILDSTGTRLVRTMTSPLGPIDDADVVDDSTVLLAGPASENPDSPWLHLWDFRRNHVRQSFFEPWKAYRYKDVASTAGWVQAAVWADTIAATFSPSDTVYLMTIRGQPIASIPMRSSNFRLVHPLADLTEATPQERREWMMTFDLVASVYHVGEGFIVPYQGFIDGRPTWKLLGIRRSGVMWFDEPAAPRLLAGDSGGEFLFVAEGSDIPSHWRKARFRGRN